VEAYEGKSIPSGRRSLTLRAEIGAEDRTLGDADVQSFSEAFKSFLTSLGMELRA
jgi:phenylalanyl-tRNA synthetase beta subunit